MKTFAVLAFVALAAAPSAHAADTIVATAAKPTTIDAYSGVAVWSAWDPSVHAYRLTAYSDGKTSTLPVAPNRVPFDVDLGPGPNGGHVAVYSRCRKPPRTTFVLNGRRGCNLHAYWFTTRHEKPLAGANSPTDEYWPTLWRGRLAFTRTVATGRQFLYWRSLTHGGPSHRLRAGAAHADGSSVNEQLDMRGRRVTFTSNAEYGGSVRITRIGGHGRVLVKLPGSGAETYELDAQGPTIAGDTVRWGLSVAGDSPVYTEIRRVAIATRKEQRATTRIDAAGQRDLATTGFGYFGGTAWYVRDAAAGNYEIHQMTGLAYEPSPPPPSG